MRVISGQFRGRRLIAPRGQETRPTSDRVKEALFSMLSHVQDLDVLDLFAGTGALGIEALSRGAASVVFVERDPEALQALRANLHALHLQPPQAIVRAGDASATLKESALKGERYHLIFLDPPYRQAAAVAAHLAPLLASSLLPNGRIVVESDCRQPLPLPLPIERQRRYRDTSITIHRSDEPSTVDSGLSWVL